MKRIQLIGTIMFLAVGLLLTTCHKDLFDLDRLSDEVELEPGLVAPLIYGSVNMSDIMQSFDSVEQVGEFPDGLIYLAQKDTLISFLADTSFNFPDTILSQAFFLESDEDVILPISVGDTTPPIFRSSFMEFNFEGDNRLDEVMIKGGELEIKISSTLKHGEILTIYSDQIRDPNGNPFTKTITSNDVSGNYQHSWSDYMDGYIIQPVIRNDSNFIHVIFEMRLINSGAPILEGEGCSVQFLLRDFGFYHIYGFIDTRPLLNKSGKVKVPPWENVPDLSEISFADPRIEITTINSLGVPFELELDTLLGTGEEGTQVLLEIQPDQILEGPAPGFDQMGETVTAVHTINSTNSNILDFTALDLSSIYYSVEGRTAVIDNDSTHFALDESRLAITIEFLQPLYFRTTGYTLSDTMDFTLTEGGIDTSMIKNAEVTIFTVNELPLDLSLQVLFLDENDAVVDSVFDDNEPILGASVVDEATGELLQATEATNTVEFPARKLGKLDQVSYMKVRARVLTSGGGETYVKIYSNYTLDFEISMLADIRINSREL